MDLAAADISDSCSSGYWSVDRGPRSPAPSSPTTEANGRLATPTDEGLDMELDQVLFEEPAPRKRRVRLFFCQTRRDGTDGGGPTVRFPSQNSLKVAYRCLWPSCAKVLTSLVGIKRHIRTVHLR